MKFLTPEIEALSKEHVKGKLLARTNVSCGIFQDINPSEENPKLYQKQQ